MMHQPIDHGGRQGIIDVEDLAHSRKIDCVTTIDPHS